MSVTNYQPDKCKYFIGKLVKSVWLVSEEAIKDIRIDNGEAWVESISETPIRLDCYSIELTDTDSLDERYKFTHTLTFSIQGYANKDDFQGRYYAIVKDDEGTYWLVNPLFPCKVTYTYTLGNEQNHTDFTLGTVSNHPVLKLNGMVDSSTYQCKDYWLDGIDALWLNEKRYTVHNGNHVMYTNGGFKTVEYNSKSATFTETFDGTNTSHGIEFDVLFSAYQKSWHYNLLEFKDNLYAAVIKTMNDKYALCGFSLGLQPGFQVSANDTNNQIDKIHITLNDAHDAGEPIEMYDSIEYEYLSAKTWVYTDEYDGWECVDEGVARYLLQMEIDALENETGNYKALDGYASRFPYLHIVDTFDNTETFENVDCGSSACRLRSSLPSQLTFNDTGCQTYYVKAGSDWEISSSVDYIRVSPSTGSADESYVVSVCNDLEPSDTVRNSSLTIEYCNTSSTVDVSVVQHNGCFPQGSTYNITANSQVLTIPSSCCINSVRETSNVGVSLSVYQDYIQVTTPENNTGAYRTIVLLVIFCDGTSDNIVINQSDVFEKWVDGGGTFCIEHDLYKIQNLWTGRTSSSYVITPTTRNVLVQVNSPACYGEDEWQYDWKTVEGFVCDNCGDYKCLIDYSGGTYTVTGSGQITRSDVVGYSSVAEDVVVETTVSSIGDSAFSGFPNLIFVRMPNTIVSIGNNAFYDCSMMIACEIPEGVTTIGNNAFRNCTSLSMINIPDSVTSIGSAAFRDCLNFRSLSIPSGVTTIANETFYNCDGLTDIELPNSIISIGNNAFTNCESLYSVIIPINDPPFLGSGVFDGTNANLKIYVPSAYVNVYRETSGWNTYANKIFPIE